MWGRIKNLLAAIAFTIIAIGVLIIGPILVTLGSVAGIIFLLYLVLEDERKVQLNNKNKDIGD